MHYEKTCIMESYSLAISELHRSETHMHGNPKTENN